MANRRNILFATKISRQQVSQDYQPITCLKIMYKTVSRIATKISKTLEEKNFLPAEQNYVTFEVNVARIN
jgi:hypothetical protein